MYIYEQLLDKYQKVIDRAEAIRVNGKVIDVIGLVIVSVGPNAVLGEICTIVDQNGIEICKAEVVGFKNGKVLSIAIGEVHNISPACEIKASGKNFNVGIGRELLGRVIDGLGNPIDGKGEITYHSFRDAHREPPNPLDRKRIAAPIQTGIRAIDALLSIGKGQRVGIFAGSGVGKSVTLGMIARNTSADVNVIALIGERGREVREFIERDLGEEGLKRSVVVVATSDQPALIRLKGALTATTIAEYFRAEGNDVMLLMDSSTRIAMAQREIGLATGEPPATKGYTPSVFAFLPRLLERAGMSDTGSITGMYTVLVEGDDLDEPVSDAMRAILDGHIGLSRALATRNHYPAIDVLGSISRVMPDVIEKEHLAAARRLLTLMAEYRGAEDLITIGAYAKGSNPEVDRAITIMKDMNSFLCQAVGEKASMSEAIVTMKQLVEKVT